MLRLRLRPGAGEAVALQGGRTVVRKLREVKSVAFAVPIRYSTGPFFEGSDHMRENIHPAYPTAKVHCACGATWETRSTRPEIRLEICSNCHPFFTGKPKLVDTAGRVERFNRKYGRKTEA